MAFLARTGAASRPLFKVLAGFHSPDPGSHLQIHGADVTLPLGPGAFRKYRMSFVHQHLGLIPSLTRARESSGRPARRTRGVGDQLERGTKRRKAALREL